MAASDYMVIWDCLADLCKCCGTAKTGSLIDIDSNAAEMMRDAANMIRELAIYATKDAVFSRGVFDVIIEYAVSPAFAANEVERRRLLECCEILCGIKENWDRALALLNRILEDNPGSTYIYEIKYKLFKREGLGDAYLEEHLDNEFCREEFMKRCLDWKDYDLAASLCKGMSGETYSGGSWIDALFNIYELAGMEKEIRELAYEQAVKGDAVSLNRLKSLCSHEEWLDLREKIIEQTMGTNAYYEILKAEKLGPDIIDICRESPERIIEFYKSLLPFWKDEGDALFNDYIEGLALNAKGVKEYRMVCDAILKFFELSGENIEPLKQRLIDKASKRRAFVYELERI
jgi:hypothetical protein